MDIKMYSVKVYSVIVFILSGSVCSMPHKHEELQEQILKLYGPPSGEMKHHTGMEHPPPNPPIHDVTESNTFKIDPSVLASVFGSYARSMPVEPPSQLVDNKNKRQEKPTARMDNENIRPGIVFRETKPDLERTSDGAVAFNLDDRLLSRTILESQFHGNSNETNETAPKSSLDSQPTDSKNGEPHDDQKGSVDSNYISDRENNNKEDLDLHKPGPHLGEVSKNEHVGSGGQGSMQNPAVKLLSGFFPPSSHKEPVESPSESENKSNSKSNNASSRNFVSVSLSLTLLICILYI